MIKSLLSNQAMGEEIFFNPKKQSKTLLDLILTLTIITKPYQTHSWPK